VLLAAAVMVALTTATLPFVTGYGTNLPRLILLGASWPISRLGYSPTAIQSVLWPVDLALNMVLFLAIAIPVWAVFRNRAPKIASAAIISWLLFYLSMLYFIPRHRWPLTDKRRSRT